MVVIFKIVINVSEQKNKKQLYKLVQTTTVDPHPTAFRANYNKLTPTDFSKIVSVKRLAKSLHTSSKASWTIDSCVKINGSSF
ncbi:hypothetical protein DPMN_114869 [Dreissena polymorpha]|uniref:Uncharacterized protein n=1 Tax=Dreissena polymorpha TaxID=45954 RepID=A0A9D4KLT2_DREPO|nr:hypothetical protein DPMN_114869 [Dreissena polymorpha]